MHRFKILVTTMPVVATVLALVFLRDNILGLDPLLDFSDLGPILTGAAVLLGFMLAGVISDYKESEKLPAQLASTLMGVEDTFLAAVEAGKGVDLGRIRSLHAALTLTVTDWFLNRASLSSCLASITSLTTITGVVDRGGASGYVTSLLASTKDLRGLVTRVHTIRRTMFIPVAYVLLYLLVGIILVLLIFGGFDHTAVQYLVSGSVTLIYVYLIRLIRDLDNPFDYLPSGRGRGTVEVDPTPLVAYCEAVQGSLGASSRGHSLALR